MTMHTTPSAQIMNVSLSLAEGAANIFGNILDGSEKYCDKGAHHGQEEISSQYKIELAETPSEVNVDKDDLELA
uniref:AlNc14C423G11546 protein n=1 Tax=Albugo laibachii Nc14 TaxID=890382 RepID=F0WZE4_9STRA|nr:AlNc14C423G11546 [Albugo laibachii Nc14]|eukprot:CCA26864.1 AlNc14C423G11546 [Albugo laibachii Nc14]